MLSPRQLKEEIPFSQENKKFILGARRQIQEILSGRDKRLLCIVGPCSIHDFEEALEYGRVLKRLSLEVEERMFIVMRAYFEKPRTLLGWKGLVYDPHLDGSYDIEEGLRLARKLVRELTHLQIPVGSELLELWSPLYYADGLSWGCVGARTSASPPHRQLASSLPFPMGFKNTIDGNMELPLQAIVSAGSPHTFLGINEEGQLTKVQSEGNSHCHLILRGSQRGYNYYPEDIQLAVEKCVRTGVQSRILIDCSHDNSGKNPQNQQIAFEEVMRQIDGGNHHIFGMMLESYFHEGAQPMQDPLRPGLSITDPCLSWQATQELLTPPHRPFAGAS